jgi:Ca2+-binding RTX toxin-like protein
MSRTLRRVAVGAGAALVLTAGLSVLGAPPAHAAPGGSAFVNGTTLFFVAVPGTANAVWVDLANGDFRIEDVHEISAGTGCTPWPGHPNIVTCSPVGVTKILISAGNQNDTLGVRTTLGGGVAVSLNGGADSDILFGHDGDETLFGGAGADILKGGPGDDLLFGGSEGDVMYGEADTDTVSYADHGAIGITADADGADGDDGQPGEGDTIWTDVENIVGTSGSDFLAGGTGPNALDGGAGNDTLVGGAGSDHLNGGAGFDTLYGDGGAMSPGDVDVCVLGSDGGNAIGCEVVR